MFEIGHTFEVQHTFTVDDVAAFARVVRDFGEHHTTPDEHGRVIVHGLHTASLATQIGGSINYISRDMHFDFIAPVYSGDTVTCTATVDSAESRTGRDRYDISFRFVNQTGDVVATGSSKGVVRHAAH